MDRSYSLAIVILMLPQISYVAAQEITPEARIVLNKHIAAMGGAEQYLKWNNRLHEVEDIMYDGKERSPGTYYFKHRLHGMNKSSEGYLDGVFNMRAVATVNSAWETDAKNMSRFSSSIMTKQAQSTARFMYLSNLVNLLSDKDVVVKLLPDEKLKQQSCKVLSVHCKKFDETAVYYLNTKYLVIRRSFIIMDMPLYVDHEEFIEINDVTVPVIQKWYFNNQLKSISKLRKFEFLDSKPDPKIFELPKELPDIKIEPQEPIKTK